jgi:hypothetical protein
LGFGGLAAKLIDLLFLIFLIIVVSTLLAKLYICF